jgi:sensor domain CHASE-containing protein
LGTQLIDMVRKVVALLLVFLLIVSVVYSVFLYQQNVNLRNETAILKEELTTLKSASIVTALGVVEIPPYGESYWGGNGYLWITGWVFNSGANMARKAGLDVLAFDGANVVLMNYTVPITEGGIGAFSTNETLRNLIPYYLYPTPLEFGNVLSQQNVTVRLAIFHEGIFPNSTRYEINPVWENNQ